LLSIPKPSRYRHHALLKATASGPLTNLKLIPFSSQRGIYSSEAHCHFRMYQITNRIWRRSYPADSGADLSTIEPSFQTGDLRLLLFTGMDRFSCVDQTIPRDSANLVQRIPNPAIDHMSATDRSEPCRCENTVGSYELSGKL
jgi:hypothetical protein